MKTIDPYFYTTKEVRTIRENLHLTDKEIAKLIGRTRIGVSHTRYRYGMHKIPMRPEPEQIEMLRNMTDKSYVQMAMRTGMSEGQCKYHFNRLGLIKTKWVKK